MHLRFFPAFFDRPSRIRFVDQEADEHIELFLRRHWVTNIPWILTSVLILVLPFIFLRINQIFELVSIDQIPENLSLSLFVLWLMLVLAYVIESFLHWYFNIYIITNSHLVDINFHNLLNRDFVEVRIEDVQSVKSQVLGVVGHLFNYGNLIIETAAERQHIEFTQVPKPDFIKERIQDLQES